MSIRTLMKASCNAARALECYGQPLALFLCRLYLFDVFFTSGYNKLENFLNGDWASTVYLFQEIHPVPFLPPEIAAVMGTASEVGLACLLLIGLATRLSALGLLGVAAIIEISFRYVDPEYVTFDAHIMWALLLGVLLTRGAGSLSIDALLRGKCHASACSASDRGSAQAEE